MPERNANLCQRVQPSIQRSPITIACYIIGCKRTRVASHLHRLFNRAHVSSLFWSLLWCEELERQIMSRGAALTYSWRSSVLMWVYHVKVNCGSSTLQWLIFASHGTKCYWQTWRCSASSGMLACLHIFALNNCLTCVPFFVFLY